MKKLSILILIFSFLSDIKATSLSRDKDLFEAMEKNNLIRFKTLIESGANPNVKNENGDSLFHLSIQKNRYPFIKLLIKAKADLHIRDQKKNTLLHIAVTKLHLHLIRRLIKKGIDVNAKNELGQTALHKAVLSGSLLANIKALIDAGADMNAKDHRGRTPLLTAVLNKDERFVVFKQSSSKFLIESGADLNIKDENGISPLMQALKLHRIILSKLLIQHGAEHSFLNQFIIDQYGEEFFKKIPDSIDEKFNALTRQANRMSQLNRKDRIIKINKQVEKISFTDKDLFEAMKKNDLKRFKTLIEHGADPNLKNEKGDSLIHLSLEHKNMSFFKILMKTNLDIQVRDQEKNTPLHIAATKSILNFTKFLIQKGADVNSLNELGQTALHRASFFGHHTVKMKLFLDAGANINLQDQKGRTPLHLAILAELRNPLRAKDSGANFLIKNGARLNIKDENGISPLMQALRLNMIALCKLMLSYGADANLADKKGKTPLGEALRLGHVAIAELLIENGANLFNWDQLKPNESVDDFLSKHVKNPSSHMKRLIRKIHKKKSDQRQDSPSTLSKAKKEDSLFLQTMKEDKTAFQIVGKNKQSEVKEANSSFNNLFEAMKKNDLVKFRNLLLLEVLDTNPKDKRGLSLLHHSIEKRKKRFFNLLIQSETDVNITDVEKDSPLHWAVLEADTYYAKKLIEHGADPNLKNEIGKSPLHFLSSSGENFRDHALVLLRAKVDINAKDHKGKSPLHYVVISKKILKVDFLIQQGADVNLKDENGLSPLHELSEIKTYYQTREQLEYLTEIGKVLIKNGADVNLADKKGKTPLMKAAKSNNLILSKLFVSQGAVIFTKDQFGKTVLDYISDSKINEELRDFMRAEINRQDKFNQPMNRPRKKALRSKAKAFRK